MRKLVSIVSISLLFFYISGCCPAPCGTEKSPPAIVINNYTMTADEFEKEFKESSFGQSDTADSRKQFLENLIDRKLILQDAEKKGLDKKPEFLKMIEKFWEQSLLRSAIEHKAEEIACSVTVADSDIKAEYEKLIKSGKMQKTYADAYAHIKWSLAKQKEAAAMEGWIKELRNKACVKVSLDSGK